MEEDGDDLENIFVEYESNDPQPQENANNENEAAEPEKVPVPKRVVKRPRLKFNPERLCGKKGIPILVDHFKDVKFKGKGHEKEDLGKLLTTLELWTHRLFPSMKFEDCLRQIEHLGKKRPVKTCVQKIRLDFPILESDFVRNEEEEEEHEQSIELEPEPPRDAFDSLFDDYQGNAQPALTSTPSSSQTVGNVLGTSFGASISEEQKERMEYNKKLAIERRKARMSAMQSSSLGNSTENSLNVEPALNSQSSEKTVNNDPNFLFDYLQQQFTNTDEKAKEKSAQSMELKNSEEAEVDELMDLVDKDEANHDVVPIVRNNDFAKGNDREELGLDELMDLVDEGDKEEFDCDAISNVNNDNGNQCQSLDSEESEEMGLGSKDKTDQNVLSNFGNINSPNNNDVELRVGELMDLVDEYDEDETNNGMSVMQLKDRKESEKVESADEGDKHKISLNTLSNVQNRDSSQNDEKEKLELGELEDKDNPNETADDLLSIKNSVSIDKDNHINYIDPETKEIDLVEKAN